MKKLYLAPESKLDRWVQIISAILAGLSLLYYLTMGFFVGFGVSLLFVWLMLALMLGAIALCFPALRRWWMKQRKWLKVILTVWVALALAFALISSGAILSGFVSDIPADGEVDCIIVLGAQVKADHPSLSLAQRIDAAYEYLSAHPNTIAIASGGQGPDEPMSEAQCIYEHLVDMGIEPERILLEDRSTSTAENLKFSAELIPEGCKSVAIVTNNFHSFRGKATARKYLADLELYHLPADSHPILLPHYFVREIAAMLADTLRGNLKFW